MTPELPPEQAGAPIAEPEAPPPLPPPHAELNAATSLSAPQPLPDGVPSGPGSEQSRDREGADARPLVASCSELPTSPASGKVGAPTEPEAPPPPPPPPREPFWSYTDVLIFAGMAIPCMLLGYGLVHGALVLFHIHLAVRAAELLAEQMTGYVLLFSALRMLFRVEYDRPFWRSLGWTPMRAPFLWLVIAGCATAVAVAFATFLIRVPETPNPMTELLHDRISIVLLATFGVTLGPLCEELAFRGFLQPLLVRSLGPAAGIVLAAIPFGLLHIPEYGNSWRHGVVIALAGAAFGWVRHATGSTKASTIMHASYNALFFFVLLSQGKDIPVK